MAHYFRLFVFVLSCSFGATLLGCASRSAMTEQEASQRQAQNDLIAQAEQFVHANLFTGMIQVWSTDRRAWNQLLSVHACGSVNAQETLTVSYEANQPLFISAIQQLADNAAEFSSPEQQDILQNVSQLAYRLFSASYAQGYARQVALADEISPGIHAELCGGEVLDKNAAFTEYPKNLAWQTLDAPDSAASQSLEPHALNGYNAFNRLLSNQYAQFDALVYSHAYQRTDAYESLFFEVNKYENVEAYADQVRKLNAAEGHKDSLVGHDDFAFLVLSSGYHWGMMSVLAMLEEEFPEIHELKKQQATNQIEIVTEQINQPG